MTTWDINTTPSGEFLEIRKRISVLYDAGDWSGCYAEAKVLLAKFPLSVSAHIDEAALQGDFAETFTGKERGRRKAAAIRKLRYWQRLLP